jgi:hypothetical protein
MGLHEDVRNEDRTASPGIKYTRRKAFVSGFLVATDGTYSDVFPIHQT